MNLTSVGYFSKTHGLKGHLILKGDIDFYVNDVKVIFIDTQTGKAPYFISEFKNANNGLIFQLEEINTVEKAKTLIGKEVFIEQKYVVEKEEEFEWLGFELIDKQHGSLGKITGVSDNGHQTLLSVQYKGKELILPLVEDFIENTDEKTKKLFYNAPEGLIELYLNDGE